MYVCMMSSYFTPSLSKLNDMTQDLEIELRVYDRKVYRQTQQMTEDFNRRLDQMRIPFFGTRRVTLPYDKRKEGEISIKDKYMEN